jgi:hypothetical protein
MIQNIQNSFFYCANSIFDNQSICQAKKMNTLQQMNFYLWGAGDIGDKAA